MMATKTFTTDFTLSHKETLGLERALSQFSVVKQSPINARTYGKGDAKQIHEKFDSVFGK